MGSNPAYFKDSLQNPVERVSWDDVQIFIQTLNSKVSGLKARLPTESEWEYACRAGTATPFSFGDNIMPDQVNYNGGYPYNNGYLSLNRGKTVPVKSLPSNPWGLYEMHGNVWEWCADWYEVYPTGAVSDPLGSSSGVERVLRGGSWNRSGRHCRSAIRICDLTSKRYRNGGFRFVLDHA